MTSDYSAEHIRKLSGRQAVRQRAPMYIGDTSIRGFHHLVYEAVDNSIDEALAGFCSKIKVIIHQNGSVSVIDNGRGIPIAIHPKHGISALQLVLTELHAGGKFDKKTYKVSGGLHGVGISVVNFLSEKFEVIVKRNGKKVKQLYEKGKPVTEVEEIGTSEDNGTKVTFKPDVEIFGELEFHYDILAKRLRELAFLNSGIEIELLDERDDKKQTFKYEGGLKSFVEFLNKNKNPITPIIYAKKSKDDYGLEFGFQYNDGYQENIYTFANNINTIEGGTHLSGFRTALTRVLNNYAKKHKIEVKFSGDDAREGLTAIISIKLANPQFEGQTKTKLGNSEVQGIVSSLINDSLSEFLEENPGVAKTILNKCAEAARARAAAQKAKELTRRKSVLEGSTLPGKLADCSNKDASKCEVYIVEGDSAGGSAKQGRNRDFQAILPLRGKILNVEKARLNKIFENNEIVNMVTAIGTGIGDEFNIEKIRYHKIIIMTDADVDGAHIRTLILTFFFRYMKALIEAGHLYIAQPPLYKVQKGKTFKYAFTDEEMKKLTQEFGEGCHVSRYKGLGEMNPKQLWETTMNPDNRILKQVTIEDAIESDRIFTILMGDEVEPRRKFILDHAKEVVNLDI
ncbi:DNA topoisomerase (ATP-hydrolyzing) subunit B [Nanoarchaeota archaeon]